MAFEVTEVIDGNTFLVSPLWVWNDKKGDTIRAHGYNTPEQGQPGYQEAKEKLEKLILGKNVILQTAFKIIFERVLCEVYIEGKSLASFFPEYQ